MSVEVTKRSGEGLQALRSELLYDTRLGTLLRVATSRDEDIDRNGVISLARPFCKETAPSF